MRLAVKDLEEGMIIEVDGFEVLVEEVIEQQGEGLGVIVRGTMTRGANPYRSRFLDKEETVKVWLLNR